MITASQSKQKYVAGSFIPGFFWGTDFYPDPAAPDNTDMSLVSGRKHIQFKLGESGTVVTVECAVTDKTIAGESHQGLLVSAANMAATLSSASEAWFWRFDVDLAGDSNPCYSEWQRFTVY